MIAAFSEPRSPFSSNTNHDPTIVKANNKLRTHPHQYKQRKRIPGTAPSANSIRMELRHAHPRRLERSNNPKDKINILDHHRLTLLIFRFYPSQFILTLLHFLINCAKSWLPLPRLHCLNFRPHLANPNKFTLTISIFFNYPVIKSVAGVLGRRLGEMVVWNWDGRFGVEVCHVEIDIGIFFRVLERRGRKFFSDWG